MLTISITDDDEIKQFSFSKSDLLNDQNIVPIRFNGQDYTTFCRSILLFSDADQTLTIEDGQVIIDSDLVEPDHKYNSDMLTIAKLYNQNKYDQITKQLMMKAKLNTKLKLMMSLPKLMYLFLKDYDKRYELITKKFYRIDEGVLDLILTEFRPENSILFNPDFYDNDKLAYVFINHRVRIDGGYIQNRLKQFYIDYLNNNINKVNQIGQIFYMLVKNDYVVFNMSHTDKSVELLKTIKLQYFQIRNSVIDGLLFNSYDDYMRGISAELHHTSLPDNIGSILFGLDFMVENQRNNYSLRLNRFSSIYIYHAYNYYRNLIDSVSSIPNVNSLNKEHIRNLVSEYYYDVDKNYDFFEIDKILL